MMSKIVKPAKTEFPSYTACQNVGSQGFIDLRRQELSTRLSPPLLCLESFHPPKEFEALMSNRPSLWLEIKSLWFVFFSIAGPFQQIDGGCFHCHLWYSDEEVCWVCMTDRDSDELGAGVAAESSWQDNREETGLSALISSSPQCSPLQSLSQVSWLFCNIVFGVQSGVWSHAKLLVVLWITGSSNGVGT